MRIVVARTIAALAVTAMAVYVQAAPSTSFDKQAGRRIHYSAGRYPVLALPGGERRQVRSLLAVPGPLSFGDYVWDAAGVPPGRLWVRVDLALQMISVFRSGHEIGTAVILYGADSKPTPSGVYPILARAARHRSTLYDADMPYMLRLTHDGVAIHASEVRASAATHGCIGVPLGFAWRLFGQARTGDRVAIMAAPRRRK